MADAAILKIDDLEVFQRGDGVETTLLVGAERVAEAHVTTGITRFPAGRRAPMHSHNCGEQVTILEGTAECVVDGATTVLKPYDTTFIPADRPHCFHNAGNGPACDPVDLRHRQRHAHLHRDRRNRPAPVIRRQGELTRAHPEFV